MTGTPRADRAGYAPSSGRRRSDLGDDLAAGEVTLFCDAPDGYSVPPIAAQVILRVMKDVTAREGKLRMPIGRAG